MYHLLLHCTLRIDIFYIFCREGSAKRESCTAPSQQVLNEKRSINYLTVAGDEIYDEEKDEFNLFFKIVLVQNC